MKISASERFSDREAFAEAHRRFLGEDASDEAIEKFRLDTLAAVREERVQLTDPGGVAFSFGMRHAIEQVPMIFEFNWTLLIAAGGFATSDRGFAIHDPGPLMPWQAPALLSSSSSQTTFPLSERACLLVRPESMDGALSVTEVDQPVVEALNLRTLGWAGSTLSARPSRTWLR